MGRIVMAASDTLSAEGLELMDGDLERTRLSPGERFVIEEEDLEQYKGLAVQLNEPAPEPPPPEPEPEPEPEGEAKAEGEGGDPPAGETATGQ